VLSPGSRLGPYEIVSLAGAGGMGEVYKAKDTRLDRTVAIKILPPALAADPQFRERFDREARTISQLTHPHICRLYDVGHQSSTDFLVMEFLDGESLADRLTRSRGRPLPLQETIAVAIQIAEALDAAHRAGIIHRDLKPGNVILTAAGAKLVDFGLAKQGLSFSLTSADGHASPSLTSPPTVTSPLTLIGSIVGTLQYMAPEQLDGKEADARSDVFAFGAVVYEMLSGRRAFQGKTQVSVMAAIMEQDPPPLASMDASYPAALTRLVEKCLAKDPKDRWQSVADLADELRWIARERGSRPAPAPGADVTRVSLRSRAIVAAALAVASIAIVVAGLALSRARRPPSIAAVGRFEIQSTADQPLAVSGGQDRSLAISPDGQHIAYCIGQAGSSQIFMRDVSNLEGRVIANGRQPFFSPDSASVGFATMGNQIMRVAVTGGPATLVTQLTGNLRGATWGPDDTIVLATTDRTGLLSMSSAGGQAKEITKPDTAAGEHDHYFPSVLPNGHAVLFTIAASGGLELNKIAVLDLATGQQKVLVQGASQAEYVEDDSGRGYLLYAAGATVRAARFDADRLELRGNAVPVVDQVMTVPNGAANYAVARNGTMVFIPGGLVGILGGLPGVARTLTWVDRKGHEDPIDLPARSYSIARLSPDEKRLALEIDDQNNDIWTADLSRRTLSRLTTDPGSDTRPVWTTDGKRIIFTSTRTGAPNLFWRASDASGSDERLTESADLQLPSAVTSDDRLLFVEVVPGHAGDIMSLGLGPPSAGAASRAEPLIATTFLENNPEPSPDGRWIAYSSNSSGVNEVYVRPYPNVKDALSQVSSGGGSRPVWRGSELFFLDANNMLTSVRVDTNVATFSAGRAVRLLNTAYFSGSPQRPYDVTADGQKFLMIKDPGGDRSSSLPRIVVVLNWMEELKTRVR
jgi:eukaryotic-like serine/threonine-protein kinase